MDKVELVEKAIALTTPYMVEGFKKFSTGCVYFFETGTNYGNGIWKAIALNKFEKYFTCEIHEERYRHCVSEFAFDKNIHFYHGRSIEALELFLPQIDKKTFFYLDAHGEGGGTPTYEELDLIKQHGINTHHILIDDIPVYFAGKRKDQLVEKLLDINPEYVIESHATIREDYQLGAFLP